jgi:hypothetical protein
MCPFAACRGEVCIVIANNGSTDRTGAIADRRLHRREACTAVPAQEWGGAAAPRVPADVERRFGPNRPGAAALQLYDCQGRAAQLAAR